MSYILDALKRADAERERGAVPGLHTQQATTLIPHAAPSPQRRLWAALAMILALGGSAVGLWVWQTSGGDARPPTVESAAARPATPPAWTPPVVAADVAPAAVSKPVPPAAPAVVVQALSKPRAAPVAKAAAPGAVAVSAPVALPLALAPPTQTVALAVPLLSEISEDIRRQIPTLTITGAVDSEHPAQRMLLVNGQVLRQGNLVAPELSLEEIRARSSTFSFRGTKFRVAY